MQKPKLKPGKRYKLYLDDKNSFFISGKFIRYDGNFAIIESDLEVNKEKSRLLVNLNKITFIMEL